MTGHWDVHVTGTTAASFAADEKTQHAEDQVPYDSIPALWSAAVDAAVVLLNGVGGTADVEIVIDTNDNGSDTISLRVTQ